MSPFVFNKNSQKVRVMELKKVVVTTVLEVSTPSCPRFFAIIKQLAVVGAPNMTNMATSSSPRKPR